MLHGAVRRDELVKRVIDALRKQRYVAAICSPQSGLSQVLHQLREQISYELAGSCCIKVDVANLGAAEQTRFCDYFGHVVSGSGDMEGLELTGLSLTECLSHLASQASPCTILLIDNFHRLSIHNQKRFLAETRAFYTEGSIKPDSRKILVVIGGAIDLWACEPNSTSPWNIAERIYPQEFDLSSDEVRRYALSVFFPLGLHIDSVAAQYLEEVTRGHAYLLQRLCAEVARHKQSDTRREILIDDVEAATEHVLSEPDQYLNFLVDEISKLDADFKLFLCEVLNGIRHKFSRNEPYTRCLELLGVVAPTEGYVGLRNPIVDRHLRRSLAERLPRSVAPTDLLMPCSIGANLKAYEVLFSLENSLRNFIISALYTNYGKKWKNYLPKDKRWSEAEARQKTERRDPYLGQPRFPILAYCHFTDLRELIEHNWELFKGYFGPKEKFANTYARLEEFRNTIAHNRPLSHHNFQELERIRGALTKCMTAR